MGKIMISMRVDVWDFIKRLFSIYLLDATLLKLIWKIIEELRI